MTDQPAPKSEGEHLLYFYRKLSDAYLNKLHNLSEDELNWDPPTRQGNSIYAIAYHAISAAHWWLNVALGNITERERDSEFSAKGTFSTIEERFKSWLRTAEQEIPRLTEADYEAEHIVRDGTQTTRQALYRTLEHLSLHLGHIEITLQWMERNQRAESIH